MILDFWKANEELYNFELISHQFEKFQNRETSPVPLTPLSQLQFHLVSSLPSFYSWCFKLLACLVSLQHAF